MKPQINNRSSSLVQRAMLLPLRLLMTYAAIALFRFYVSMEGQAALMPYYTEGIDMSNLTLFSTGGILLFAKFVVIGCLFLCTATSMLLYAWTSNFTPFTKRRKNMTPMNWD